MQEIARFNRGNGFRVDELIRDLAEGREVVSLYNLTRLVGGGGWHTREDSAGYWCVSEFSAQECDEYITGRQRSDAEALARHRQVEEWSREESRQARDLGPASIRAPR